jgi:hypothetical protein
MILHTNATGGFDDFAAERASARPRAMPARLRTLRCKLAAFDGKPIGFGNYQLILIGVACAIPFAFLFFFHKASS